MYKKRPGTSGVYGQLYESKLLSLILLRAKLDEHVEEFYLASNVADLGAFDDICFKVKLKDNDQPLLAFIQVKHKQNHGASVSQVYKDLAQYFNSYVAIKEKFNPRCKDKIFNEEFHKTNSLFILYTNATGDDTNISQHIFASHLNRLIATGGEGVTPQVNDEVIQFISKSYTATTLAKRFVKFLYTKNNEILMNDEYITTYHIVLAQKVVDVSEVQSNRRTCTFRDDFLCSNDEFLVLLRDELYKEVLKVKKTKEKSMQELHMSEFLKTPSVRSLSRVIDNDVGFEDGKFISHTSEDVQARLDDIKLPSTAVNEAIKLAAIDVLKSSQFSVPAAFGNSDLIISGNDTNVERRLNHLAASVIELISRCKPSKLIIIDEAKYSGILRLNGGLGSAVGKLLVYDVNRNNIKFTNNRELLNDHARRLLEKLENEIDNLQEYRFYVRGKNFPKTSFDCDDDRLVREFLRKVVIYANQGDQNYVEWVIKREIEDHQRRNRVGCYTYDYTLTSDAIYLKYHDEIQKWWMSSKKDSVPYLTKSCTAYDRAVKSIVSYPQISTINMMYMNEIKSIEYNIQFCKTSIETFKFLDTSSAIIVTPNAKLSVMKVLQYLEDRQYVILDLNNYISRMSVSELSTLTTELNNLNKGVVVIIVCENIRNDTCYEKLRKLYQASHESRNIVVTNMMFVHKVKHCFQGIDKEFMDKEHRLIDLDRETREQIVTNTKIVFQGKEQKLHELIGFKVKDFVEGDVLYEIIHNNTYILSESPSDSEYDNIKHLYVGRKVIRGCTDILPETLFDIRDDIVIITAEAGMGKSTLLTHLSLETIRSYKDYMTVRINLADHSAVFNKWQVQGTDINVIQILDFICRDVITKSTKNSCKDMVFFLRFDTTYRLVYLEDFIGDARTKFELNIFLSYYHSERVIFLFDGFDEICPYYSDIVIKLINVIKNDAKFKKIWISSRSYSHIVSQLETVFGEPYKLTRFTRSQLEKYLLLFWKTNLQLSKLNDEQVNKVRYLLNQTSAHNVIHTATLSRSLGQVKVSFISYLVSNLHRETPQLRCRQLNTIIHFLLDNREVAGAASTHSADNQESESPLFTYLAANYFVNRVLSPDRNADVLSFDIDISSLYESFIDTIVQKHFEDKHKVSIYNPVTRMEFMNTLANVKEQAKKVAAYVIFEHKRDNIFNSEQLEEVVAIINAIKSGKVKISVICSVSNDVPQFAHRTFAEYLAVDFLFDLMKIKDHDERQLIVQDLFGYIVLLSIWINQKLLKEEYRELRVYFPEKEDLIIPLPAL